MSTVSEEIKVWEQLPSESAKAYAAAKLYFEMGPDRSLATLARWLGKSHDLMRRWSAKFDWQERAAARDRWLAHRRRGAIETAEG